MKRMKYFMMALVFGIVFGLFGCGKAAPEPETGPASTVVIPEGTLTSVQMDTGGGMERLLSILATPDWLLVGSGEVTEQNAELMIPMPEEDWAAVEEAVQGMTLTEYEYKSQGFGKLFGTVDGAGETSFSMTWMKGEKNQKMKIAWPDDSTAVPLMDLLYELAERGFEALESGNASAEPPGKLIGLNYEIGSSTVMLMGFSIELTPDEVIQGNEDEVCVEHKPVTPKQWEEVEKAVLALYPNLQEIVYDTSSVTDDEFSEIEVLDGGEYRNLTLVWDTEAGEQEISYTWKDSDLQFRILIEMLRELVNPTGREIPPVLSGFSVMASSEDLRSFNIEMPEEVGGEAHVYEMNAVIVQEELSGEKKIITGTVSVPDEEWAGFAAFLETMNLEQDTAQKEGNGCQLWYSDGYYRNQNLSSEKEKQIKEYLTELALRLGIRQ